MRGRFCLIRIHASRRGSALVVVLAVLGAILVVVGATMAEARARAALAAARLERERLRVIAAGEVERAMSRLANDDDLLCDHSDETWARPERHRTPDGDAVETIIEDEQRLWDLNNLAADPTTIPRRPPEDILTDLFQLVGDASPGDRILAVRDWVDADQDGPREASYYVDMTPRRTPPNRPLESWDELEWIAGFPSGWYFDPSQGAVPANQRVPVRELITLIPGPHRRVTPINLNSAPEPLMMILFGRGQQHIARAVATLRAAAPLRSTDGLTVLADPLQMARLMPYLDVKSEWFRIRVQVRGARQRVYAETLVRRSADGTVRVVQWWSD